MIDRLPRRVLMTADTVGGVWCYATGLARALEPCGVEVLLATMGARLTPAQRAEVSRIGNLQLAESAFKLEWMEDPWRDVEAAGDWLLRLEENFEPDVIHLNGYAHAALPWSVPAIVVAHSCVLSWWKAVKGETASDAWDTYRHAVQRGLRAAEAVVAPTYAMRDCLVEHYGEMHSTELIPNGRELHLFQPGIKEDFVLSAGRLWDEAKNVRAVCACSLSWPICVAGETQHPNGTARPADLEGVRCLGHLSSDAMLDWFARAGIYALPARYEPFGLSVLEAALSGCALVLGDIPSLRENWDGAAVFVHPDDTSRLQAVLLELTRDAQLRADLATRARERGLEFDIARTARRYFELYRALMAGAGERKEAMAL